MAPIRDLEDNFNSACDHLPSLVSKLDKSILLKFYALYKQATIGECNIEKPSWYNMEAKSKYNAWLELGSMPKQEAMIKYIQLLNEVDANWMNQAEQETDWDENLTSEQGETQSKGWVNVSSMINSEIRLEDAEKNVYEWCKEGDLDMLIQALSNLKQFDINQHDENGVNCLHWACDRGHLHVVQHLVEKCAADVNYSDSEGDTGLDYARAIEHDDLIQYLEQKGAKTG